MTWTHWSLGSPVLGFHYTNGTCWCSQPWSPVLSFSKYSHKQSISLVGLAVRHAAPGGSSCLAPTPVFVSTLPSLTPHLQMWFFTLGLCTEAPIASSTFPASVVLGQSPFPLDCFQSSQTGMGVASGHTSSTLNRKLLLFCFFETIKCSSKPWHCQHAAAGSFSHQ